MHVGMCFRAYDMISDSVCEIEVQACVSQWCVCCGGRAVISSTVMARIEAKHGEGEGGPADGGE
jgi:hypothetical protein